MIPRIIDGGNGVIVVALEGETLRAWDYDTADEHWAKILRARDYVVGWRDGVKWCDGIDAAELSGGWDTGKEAANSEKQMSLSLES